jgi:hypothetical protein
VPEKLSWKTRSLYTRRTRFVWRSARRPDEAEQRPALFERQPNDVLLGLRIRLRRVFGRALGRRQAAVLRLKPTRPVRRGRVADVGARRSANPRRRRHASAHYHFLCIVAGSGMGVSITPSERSGRRDAQPHLARSMPSERGGDFHHPHSHGSGRGRIGYDGGDSQLHPVQPIPRSPPCKSCEPSVFQEGNLGLTGPRSRGTEGDVQNRPYACKHRKNRCASVRTERSIQ